MQLHLASLAGTEWNKRNQIQFKREQATPAPACMGKCTGGQDDETNGSNASNDGTSYRSAVIRMPSCHSGRAVLVLACTKHTHIFSNTGVCYCNNWAATEGEVRGVRVLRDRPYRWMTALDQWGLRIAVASRSRPLGTTLWCSASGSWRRFRPTHHLWSGQSMQSISLMIVSEQSACQTRRFLSSWMRPYIDNKRQGAGVVATSDAVSGCDLDVIWSC